MLQTFEQRRNQLIAKATISATAASGLIVLVLQTMLQPDSTRLAVRIIASVTVLFSMLSLLEGLNITKKLSKRSSRNRSRTHLLYFGIFARLDAQGAVAALSKIDEAQYLAELAAQAVSLAKNLRMRYDALGNAYRWLALSVAAFVVALALQQAYVMARVSPTGTTPSTSTTPTQTPFPASPTLSGKSGGSGSSRVAGFPPPASAPIEGRNR